MVDPTTFNPLRQFRAGAYRRFGARRDALFELLDAATVAGLVPSLAYLSLPAVYRRGWGSRYDALAAGTMDGPALRELLGRYPLDDGQPIDALDTSLWARNDAATSPERGYYSSSARQSAGQPIQAGWSYAWLAQLSFTVGRWPRCCPPPRCTTRRCWCRWWMRSRPFVVPPVSPAVHDGARPNCTPTKALTISTLRKALRQRVITPRDRPPRHRIWRAAWADPDGS